MPTVHVNDIGMYYEVHGEGEPLLMVREMSFETSNRRIRNARIKQC